MNKMYLWNIVERGRNREPKGKGKRKEANVGCDVYM